MHKTAGLFRFAGTTSLLLLMVGAAIAQSSNAQPHPKHPSAGPEVTEVEVRPLKTRVGQPCPGNFTFYGTIATNGPGKVTYQWVGSGGKTWPKQTLTFTAATPKSVHETWRLGAPGKKVDAWVELQILNPNRKTSNRVTLDFTCAAQSRKK